MRQRTDIPALAKSVLSEIEHGSDKFDQFGRAVGDCQTDKDRYSGNEPD